MKYCKLALTVSFVVVLSGCSSTSGDTQDQTAQNNSDLICEVYTPTGTHLKKKICRTPQQVEWEKSVGAERTRAMTIDQNTRNTSISK